MSYEANCGRWAMQARHQIQGDHNSSPGGELKRRLILSYRAIILISFVLTSSSPNVSNSINNMLLKCSSHKANAPSLVNFINVNIEFFLSSFLKYKASIHLVCFTTQADTEDKLGMQTHVCAFWSQLLFICLNWRDLIALSAIFH